MRVTPAPGCIGELELPSGRLGYFQMVRKDKVNGALIRVLDGVAEKRPASFTALVERRERFFVYFPLVAAVRRGIVQLVGAMPIPEFVPEFPPMRKPGGVAPGGRVLNWWIVRETGEERVDVLSEEQRQYSLAATTNDTMLAQRIDSDWRPELWT